MSEAIERKLKLLAHALIHVDDSDVLPLFLDDFQAVLERELKPLLEAGQAMRDAYGWSEAGQTYYPQYHIASKWDAALAPAQAGKGSKNGLATK